MSRDRTPAFQRTATAHDSDGDVAIAYIWFFLFVIMAVGGLFVNPNGPVVALVLLAAVFGGWGLLDWRRKKKADHAMRAGRHGCTSSAINFRVCAVRTRNRAVF
jgi:hypothetical protein